MLDIADGQLIKRGNRNTDRLASNKEGVVRIVERQRGKEEELTLGKRVKGDEKTPIVPLDPWSLSPMRHA